MSETGAEVFALIVSGQDGEHTTSAGNPLIAIDTGPEKPFKPLTEIVTGVLVVPACALNDEGATEMEKSGAAEMDRLSGALWLRLPLVACTVTATVPAEALAGTTTDTCAEALALIENEQDGEQVVPEGSPLIETETDPEKPFEPVIESVTGALVVPGCTLTDEGETEMEKSGGGGGGLVTDPPPQPFSKLAAAISHATSMRATREM